MKDVHEYFTCECQSPWHLMALYVDIDRGDPNFDDCILAFQMNHYLPWYKRLWIATKYVLGVDTDNMRCHWTEFVFNRDTAAKMMKDLERYVNREN